MATNYNRTSSGDIINQENFEGIGVYKVQQNQSINEAAQVNRLIELTAQSYPTETISQKAIVVEEAVRQIENNPILKKKVINAIKSGSLAAFEKTIDNPFGAFFVEAIKGWKEIE